MVAIYVRWIKSGWLTLKDVPDKWRAAVKTTLESEG